VHNLFVSGATGADFVSYCPEFPEPLDLFYVQVKRDDVEIKSYELLVRMFLSEVEKELASVQQLRTVAIAV
jgi:hypothetical protein